MRKSKMVNGMVRSKKRRRDKAALKDERWI